MTKNIQNNNPLASQPLGKMVAKFAIPAIISMLVSSLYNIVDQIFIGQGVGLLGNAATNVAFPITTICIATALLFGIGGASHYNLELGAGNKEKAETFMATSLSLLFICGVIIGVVVFVFRDPLLRIFGATDSVLPYALEYTRITAIGIPFLILTSACNHLIRADGSPRYSMIAVVVGAIINTILDPIFIFSFGWGIQGAAWATIIGQIVSGLLVFFYFWKLKNVNLEWKMFLPKGPYVKLIIALGAAASINQIAMLFSQIVMNNVLRYYGEASIYGGDIPLACVGVVTKVNMVFLSICIGISQGCQPLWGFNYGAENYRRVRETYKLSALWCTAIAVLFFACFQIFPRQIISIFGSGSEEYFVFAERYLKIFMFMTFANGIQPMSSGFFTSIGKAQLGVVMSLTRQVIFLLPLIIIFPLFMGIDGVMYAGPIADGAAAVIAILFASRELNKMKALEL